jgi:hypothetical protein
MRTARAKAKSDARVSRRFDEVIVLPSFPGAREQDADTVRTEEDVLDKEIHTDTQQKHEESEESRISHGRQICCRTLARLFVNRQKPETPTCTNR